MTQQTNILELKETILIAFSEITAEMQQNIFCEYVIVVKEEGGTLKFRVFLWYFLLIFLNIVENKAQ